MKNNTYFVSAVTIAFLIPIVIGTFYFIKVSKYHNSNYLTNLNTDEIVLIGENVISKNKLKNIEKSLYQEGNMTEFMVIYTDGNKDQANYGLYLKSINISPNIDLNDINWILTQSENKKDYEIVNSGTFDDLKENEIFLGTFELNRGESKNYKLYYFLNPVEESSQGSLEANIVLEQE